MKVLLVGITILALGLTSCAGSDGGNTDNAGKRPCSEVEKDLEQAEAAATERAGTPDGKSADDKVDDLKNELESCDDGSEETTTTEAEASTTTTEAEECPDGHVVVLDERRQNRYLSDGIQAVESEDMREEVANWVMHDPVGLFSYYNEGPLGQTDPIRHVESLVQGGTVENGACYSEAGRRAYARWLPLWETAGIEPTSQMPEGWANSGVSEGWPTSGPAPTGNTAGWIVTYVDATGKATVTHGVMKRCGNLVTPTPSAPPGPTDEVPEAPPAKPVPRGKNPALDPADQGNTGTGVAGPEEGPSDEGGPQAPAGRPPGTYVPPTTPTAPPTTQPGPTVTAPPTTSPPATTPPTTAPPTTEVPPRR